MNVDFPKLADPCLEPEKLVEKPSSVAMPALFPSTAAGGGWDRHRSVLGSWQWEGGAV